MRASKFEFEQRFWVIGALIFIAFSLGAIDHVNFAVGLLHWIAPAIDPDSARGNFCLRLTSFAFYFFVVGPIVKKRRTATNV